MNESEGPQAPSWLETAAHVVRGGLQTTVRLAVGSTLRGFIRACGLMTVAVFVTALWALYV